ncbi:hypothetical protein SAICODRAFT_30539 [Saitoella complicata NRRL Y-17804]|uniref:uncharacterized protein n=1 Tax=Saitoella complicata (strain BCRC 22490 / CBS 7301 / JCM 7358 / NBRC 10748 / NRRL Y-17804) TaxID=698492 RepID=UPI0008669D68|nr:uncharacterized protein SAICODRAFT_30539 [Saitoella complicata NRRL Y-17804]ODQ52730.1 hypothetical protein SAICODRAFT_30539 [Saitoella complicata NRRL Y-17804]
MREDACSELLDHLAKRDPEIKSFLNALHHFFPNTLYSISCRPCTNTTAAGLKGYFNSGPRVARIILCSDSLRPSELRSTLIHELTHAFDHARPGTFATELHRTACTEVRASLLGQCREITNLEVRRDCVFRDAVGSVSRHVGGDEGVARRVVGEVMEGCAGDGEPMGMFREAVRRVREGGGEVW